MFTISQAAIEQISNDIRTGKNDEYVASFFAARPDWQEDDGATETDKTEEKKEEVKA